MQSLISQHGAARGLMLTDAQVSRLVRLNQIPYVQLPNGEIRFDPAALSVWIRGLQRPLAVAGGISQPYC